MMMMNDYILTMSLGVIGAAAFKPFISLCCALYLMIGGVV